MKCIVGATGIVGIPISILLIGLSLVFAAKVDMLREAGESFFLWFALAFIVGIPGSLGLVFSGIQFYRWLFWDSPNRRF